MAAIYCRFTISTATIKGCVTRFDGHISLIKLSSNCFSNDPHLLLVCLELLIYSVTLKLENFFSSKLDGISTKVLKVCCSGIVTFSTLFLKSYGLKYHKLFYLDETRPRINEESSKSFCFLVTFFTFCCLRISIVSESYLISLYLFV